MHPTALLRSPAPPASASLVRLVLVLGALALVPAAAAAEDVCNARGWGPPYAEGGSEHTGHGPPPPGYGTLAYSHAFTPADGACRIRIEDSCRSDWPWPWFEHANAVRAWASFQPLHVRLAGNYTIASQVVLNGLAGIQVPRPPDFWGGSDARMTVKLWIKVYAREPVLQTWLLQDTREQVIYDRFSQFTTEAPVRWNNVAVQLTAADVALSPVDPVWGLPWDYMIHVGLAAEAVVHGSGGNGGGFTLAVLEPATGNWWGHDYAITTPSWVYGVSLWAQTGDTTPPTTWIVNNFPPPGSAVCKGMPVVLQSDDPGGCGVAATYWRLGSGSTREYTGAILLDTTGTLRYWSVDLGGNTEAHHDAPYVVADPSDAPRLVGLPDGSGGVRQPIVLEWQAAWDADRYRLQVDDDPGFASPLVDREVGTTRDTLWSANGSALYRWRVQARLPSCGSWSEWSEPWSFSTAPVVSTPAAHGPPVEFALGAARPNPARGRVTLVLELPRAGPASVEIFQPDGRRVVALAAGPMPAGATTLVWDGRGRDGRPAPCGIYLCRATWEGASRIRRIALVR